MSSEKSMSIDVQSGKQKMLRYTIASLNAVTLVGSILFVAWILGKMIGALHALVFSLAFAATPDQPSPDFPMLDNVVTRTELHSMLQEPEKPVDSSALYRLESNN